MEFTSTGGPTISADPANIARNFQENIIYITLHAVWQLNRTTYKIQDTDRNSVTVFGFKNHLLSLHLIADRLETLHEPRAYR